MASVQQRDTQTSKIETARDLQAKLYREIGISAVAAALRFTTRPDSSVTSPAAPKKAEQPPAATIAA